MKASGQNPLRHIAFIMDGNGRWAKHRSEPRLLGHKAGAETVKRVVEFCHDAQIPYLTLYAFSTENWKRSVEEVNDLMALLEHYLDELIPQLKDNNYGFRVIGQLERLPEKVREKIEIATNQTKNNTESILTLAISYGGREEITRACQHIVEKILAGNLVLEDISEATFAENLYTTGIPDPDLIVRTAGESRWSNFLLWQGAYAEFWVTKTLWPDFDKEDFECALEFYKSRKRNFGGR